MNKNETRLAKIAVIFAIGAAFLILVPSSTIINDFSAIVKDMDSLGSNHRAPIPSMLNVSMDVSYSGNTYPLILEVNRTDYDSLQYFHDGNPVYTYLADSISNGNHGMYRVYSEHVDFSSSAPWFPGASSLLEKLTNIYVGENYGFLTLQNMSSINTEFSSFHNASSFWNEADQKLILGLGWVFNNIDFVGKALAAIENLLYPSSENKQIMEFVAFEYVMFEGSQSLKTSSYGGEYNSVINTLLNYNVVSSATYSDAQVLSGFSGMQYLTVRNLTLALFSDLFGASVIPAAVNVGAYVTQSVINDSSSVGVDAALQVAGNMADQETADVSLNSALSDVLGSFLSIDFPLALIAALANLLDKYVKIPLNYIGLELHVESLAYQNISSKYVQALSHMASKGVPDLSNVEESSNFYVALLSLASIWYFVDSHLNASNHGVAKSDTLHVQKAMQLVAAFNDEAGTIL
ncbi:MAG: hypothetical protein M1431_07555 [Candidatus Thermoplasmatota archaeon]|nr:hypothetical protein [Candidatus Thermoplasmatota archaeon]